MNLQRRLWGLHGPRLLRFGAVGLSGVLVNNAILFLLVERVGWDPVAGSLIATETAIANNFVLNDRWTFSDSPRQRTWWRRLLSYNLLTLGGLVMSVLALAALTHLAHVHYLVANVIAIGAGTAWNYISNHRWTWSLKLRTGLGAPGNSVTGEVVS